MACGFHQRQGFETGSCHDAQECRPGSVNGCQVRPTKREEKSEEGKQTSATHVTR